MHSFDDCFTFVEPHMDDCILASGSLLLMEGSPIEKIITVFNTVGKNDDIKEAESLYKKELNMNYTHLGYTPEYFSLEVFKDQIQSHNNIILPMGCGHDHHFLLSNYFMLNRTVFDSILFVRDFPHSYRPTNQFEKFIYKYNLKKVFEIEHNPKKFELFEKCFKSQKMLLFYDKKYFESAYKEEYYCIDDNTTKFF